MGDDQQRRSGFAHLSERGQNPPGRCRVEVAGRFIGEDQPRPIDQGPRDRDALRFAHGESGGGRARPGGETELVEERIGGGERGAATPQETPRRKGNIVASRQVLDQVVALEDETQLLETDPAPRRCAIRPGVAAGERQLSGRRTIEKAEQL